MATNKSRYKSKSFTYLRALLYVFICICGIARTEEEEDRTEPHPDPTSITTSSYHANSPLRDIIWCGSNSEVMLVHTIIGEVYRSTDKGATWEYKHNHGSQPADNLIPAKSRVSSIILSEADPSLVFFIGTKGISWVSEDCGGKLNSLSNKNKIQEIKFHPTERSWLLASSYSSCDDFDQNEDCKPYTEVYVTTDLGKKWQFLQDHVIQYDWGKMSKDDGIHEKQVLIIKQTSKSQGEEANVWSRYNNIYLSNDFFKSSKIILKGGNYFKLTRDYLYAGRITKDNKKVLTRALRKYQTFFDMPISKSSIHQFDFSVIESLTGAVFLFVTKPGKNINSGNIYLSDATGTGFSINLENVPFSSRNEYDFLEIESLEGVIIANTFDSSTVTPELESKKGGKGKRYNVVQATDTQRQSYITFNRGGKWEKLNPPEVSSTGKKIKCDKDKGCSLHLHSLTSDRYPFPYSVKNAIGIIVGIGNCGQFLQYDDNKLNTYISRDGGYTWVEVIKGPHIVEFGDHGGIILLAPLYKQTDYILYTWNYGTTWEAFKLPSKMQVDNILIEPLGISTSFVVFGEPEDGNTGLMISMDFNDLHKPSCQGQANPGADNSDYEYWTPHDGRHGSECFLGRKVSYMRRKKDSPCFNGELYEAEQFIKNCECSRLDFECDNGFKKEPDSDVCIQVQNITEQTVPDNCEDYYTITSGYRKIPGDTCEGGEDYVPIRIMCPNSWGLFSFRTFMLLCLTLLFGYFSAKYINENGFPTLDDLKALILRKDLAKEKDEDDFYNDNSSDDEIKETKNPTLQLEQDDNEYNEFLEDVSLKTKKR